jgi:hypothetical protein
VQNLHFAVRGVFLAVGVAALGACGSSASSAAPDAHDGGTEAAYQAVVVPPPANLDKTPLPTTLAANTWSWVPVDGALCRDGSSTGIAVNLNPASKDLVIYLEGGGACFNNLTCGTNPKCFDPPGSTTCGGVISFDNKFGAANNQDGGSAGTLGILDRTLASNPVKDWNYVYVPFCTGDVHAGNHPDATVPGVAGKQQFVGYVNMTRYLARLVPTFKDATKVLLTGISAGGFGAAANYPQTAKAFAPIPVYDLDDSGPPMDDPYVPKCLQKQWSDIWGFENTILADCGPDCPDHTNYTLDATIHTAKLYPNVPFGLVEDTDDSVITLFYGFGANNCAAAVIPSIVSGQQFTAGLLDERAKVQAAGLHNVGGFIFQGQAHTSIGATSTFTSVSAGGAEGGAPVQLTDWVTALVNDGKVPNAGP